MIPTDRALNNWKRVIEKLKPISKGNTIPGAKMMLEKHWLEAHPMDLTVGKVRILSRIHRKSIPEEVIEAYRSLKNRRISFNTFLQEKIDTWSEERQAVFLKGVVKVKYFSDKTLNHLHVSFGKEGSITMPDSMLAHWVENEKTIENKSFENYLKTVKRAPPKLLPQGEYICILNGKKRLRIAHKVGEVYHASLSQGAAVLFAGRIQISQIDGKNVITSINIDSGHYRHNIVELSHLIEFLKEKGVNTDALICDIRGKKLKGIEIDN